MLKKIIIFVLIPFILSISIYWGLKWALPHYALYKENRVLQKTIQPLITQTDGTYGVVVKDLKTGAQYMFNEHRSFATASLYKLWIMAETYEQIKNYKITEDDIVSDDVASMNQNFGISSDSADLTEGVITLRVAEALNQMITISHNYAALLLTEQLHESTINEFLTKQQFSESKLGEINSLPTSTAADMSKFFEQLYRGELIDRQYSDKMLELLKKQQLNTKIPALPPESTVIAHKTGELNQYSHDAGIVYTKTRDYIIVVLTETDNTDIADKKIAEISKKVYEYFNKI